jgi:UDP-MurNAc hydroxylase
VRHPTDEAAVEKIFTDKGAYLAEYQRNWLGWLDEMKASWPDHVDTDLVATLKDWWEPLLRMAPTLRGAVGAACLLRAGDAEILIDFPAGEVRPYADEEYAFRFQIARPLVEKVVAERAVDWSNSLFLSCRFTAWRAGEFNEYVYNFFKSLSVERMRRTEAEAIRKLNPPTETEPDIELDGWVMQRRCPHRNADLSVFGEVGEDGCTLTCTLHGWQFDLESGRCLTSADHPIRAHRRQP